MTVFLYFKFEECKKESECNQELECKFLMSFGAGVKKGFRLRLVWLRVY